MSGTYQTVARVGEIPEGKGGAFEVGDRFIAVILSGGTYYAIDDNCPHQGLRSATGRQGQDRHLHLARLAVQPRGRPLARQPQVEAPVDTYPVRVEGDEIQVQV